MLTRKIRIACAFAVSLALASVTFVVGAGTAQADTCARSPFRDVSAGSEFCSDIQWLVAQNVTNGYTDGGFHPLASVSREAMAAFLYRLKTPGEQVPVCSSAPFRDVAANAPFCGEISWLVAEKVTGGYSDGGFHPLAEVSRQAMAAFLFRLTNPGEQPAACSHAPFRDVAAHAPFCGEISWLVSQKVTGGYSDGGFHPLASVSRQAMAAFLHRLYGGGTIPPPRITFGDGTYVVGKDIPAGTYRTRSGAEFCYWERLSGFSGSLDDIIANDLPSGPAVVTIARTDAGFKTEGCARWTNDLSAITTSANAPFSDGTWIVGTDISAGRWTAPGGDSCYWARLTGFSGTLDDIAANDVGVKSPVVDIAATDQGFVSATCGKWTKIGD